MTVNPLPPDMEDWCHSYPKKYALRMTGILRRCETLGHAQDIRDLASVRTFERVHDINGPANHQSRFSWFLGSTPFEKATTSHVEAFLNAPDYPEFRLGSIHPHPTRRRANNVSVRVHAATAIIQLLAFVYENKVGLNAADAKKQAKTLVKAAKLTPLPGQPTRAYGKISARELAEVHRALPTMKLPRLGAVQLALWLALLTAHGFRADGFLRSNIEHVSWGGGLACIAVPPGPTNKKTIPLFLDSVTTALLQAYLEGHPKAKDPAAPLFLDCAALEQGTLVRQDSVQLRSALVSLGRRARLPYQLGVRAFRKWVATQTVMQGGPNCQLQRVLGHSHQGRATHRYIVIGREEVANLIRGLRGSGPQGTFCSFCGHQYRAGDAVCTVCGLERGQIATDLQSRDPAQLRRDMAGQLGLRSINDLGVTDG